MTKMVDGNAKKSKYEYWTAVKKFVSKESTVKRSIIITSHSIITICSSMLSLDVFIIK